jgi:hypothetical protein
MRTAAAQRQDPAMQRRRPRYTMRRRSPFDTVPTATPHRAKTTAVQCRAKTTDTQRHTDRHAMPCEDHGCAVCAGWLAPPFTPLCRKAPPRLPGRGKVQRGDILPLLHMKATCERVPCHISFLSNPRLSTSSSTHLTIPSQLPCAIPEAAGQPCGNAPSPPRKKVTRTARDPIGGVGDVHATGGLPSVVRGGTGQYMGRCAGWHAGRWGGARGGAWGGARGGTRGCTRGGVVRGVARGAVRRVVCGARGVVHGAVRVVPSLL